MKNMVRFITKEEKESRACISDVVSFVTIESLYPNFEEEVKNFAKYSEAKHYIDLEKFLSIEEQKTFVRVMQEYMTQPVVCVRFPEIGVWEIKKKVEEPKKKKWFIF